MSKKNKKSKVSKDQQQLPGVTSRVDAETREQIERTPVPAALVNGGARRGSPAQIKWILDMLEGKVLEASSVFASAVADLTPEQKVKFVNDLKTRVPEMSYDGINQMIGALKVLPNKNPKRGDFGVPEPREGVPDLPRVRVEYQNTTTDAGVKRTGRLVLPGGDKVLAGSYGIKTKNDARFANSITFFKVWIGDRGGWDVKMYVSDDLHRVQLANSTKLEVLNKIAKNPSKAAARFGWEFKRCGICGRGLTKDESRERGIGPVCAERL